MLFAHGLATPETNEDYIIAYQNAVANALAGSTPSLCSTGVSPEFLRNCCTRVAWSDVPEIWQNAFKRIMENWDESNPAKIRGFHRL